MSVIVAPVNSPRDLALFIDLPRLLYRGDRRYVPPLTLDRRQNLDPRKGAFFTHGEAQYWLAFRNGTPAGRISAQIDHAATASEFAGTGFFGCLDAIDDAEVVKALMHEAEAWLRARGMKRVRGPCLLSMNGEPGLLVEGQGEPPMLMVPWHPEYLLRLIEACGFGPVRDLFYFKIAIGTAELEEVSRRLRLPKWRLNYTIRKLDRRHPSREIDILREVYNDAWQNNWGFIPLLEADLAAFKTQLRPFMHPDYGIIVEKDGEPLGIVLMLPNLAEMSADLGHSPSPLGWLKFLWRAKMQRFSSARVILFGVKARLSRTVEGAAVAMMLVHEMVTLARRYTLPAIEAGWVLDSNRPLIAILEQFNARRVRTLRLFEKDIQAEK
ncbi:MAG TPA: hypothetical protein PK812_00800 [Beijerinckiaceae bacterium]|nr:hypothetical protein [Beijerinckiaceae bacterium]